MVGADDTLSLSLRSKWLLLGAGRAELAAGGAVRGAGNPGMIAALLFAFAGVEFDDDEDAEEVDDDDSFGCLFLVSVASASLDLCFEDDFSSFDRSLDFFSLFFEDLDEELLLLLVVVVDDVVDDGVVFTPEGSSGLLIRGLFVRLVVLLDCCCNDCCSGGGTEKFSADFSSVGFSLVSFSFLLSLSLSRSLSLSLSRSLSRSRSLSLSLFFSFFLCLCERLSFSGGA